MGNARPVLAFKCCAAVFFEVIEPQSVVAHGIEGEGEKHPRVGDISVKGWRDLAFDFCIDFEREEVGISDTAHLPVK